MRFQVIKVTCLLLLLSLAILPANAQFSVGARAGANLATEPVPDLYHVFLARPYFGLFGQYNVSTHFALQLGLNYSGEGANYKDEGTGDAYQVRHAFLTIPLMVQYKFSFGGYIEAGPQFGILLSAKERMDDEPFADSKQYYKGTDFGAGVGVGYEFSHKTLRGFGFSARYMRGISAINKVDVVGSDIKTRVLSIGLTYRFIGNGSNKK